MSESIKSFTENLHKVETLSDGLPTDLRLKLVQSFRRMSPAEKEQGRDILFKDIVKQAEGLGLVIGHLKRTLSIPEGFQSLPLNGDQVEERLREVHRRLVDAAGVLTEAGGLLFPESKCGSEGQ